MRHAIPARLALASEKGAGLSAMLAKPGDGHRIFLFTPISFRFESCAFWDIMDLLRNCPKGAHILIRIHDDDIID